jgi:hypothetical protein
MDSVLRCYPARWRRRHGEEAAELAALLISDGTPVRSITCSYLAGAAREWLTPRPSRAMRVLACALLAVACSLGLSAGLLDSTAPARAASTTRAPGPAHCRPGSPRPSPGATPGPAHNRSSTRQARHDKTC